MPVMDLEKWEGLVYNPKTFPDKRTLDQEVNPDYIKFENVVAAMTLLKVVPVWDLYQKSTDSKAFTKTDDEEYCEAYLMALKELKACRIHLQNWAEMLRKNQEASVELIKAYDKACEKHQFDSSFNYGIPPVHSDDE